MKGEMVNQYQVGQRVKFTTAIKSGTSALVVEESGVVSKLHKSGHYGVAEIRPDHPLAATGKTGKISRRLQHVRAG